MMSLLDFDYVYKILNNSLEIKKKKTPPQE